MTLMLDELVPVRPKSLLIWIPPRLSSELLPSTVRSLPFPLPSPYHPRERYTLTIHSYGVDDPLSMNCSSKEDFTVLAEALSDSLIEKHSSSSHFPYLIEHLARSLLGPVKPEEAKKVRVAIAKVVEEKEKLAKSGNGKGGKPSLGAGKALARGKEDLSSFGEALDDDVAANDFDPDDDFVSQLSSPVEVCSGA